MVNEIVALTGATGELGGRVARRLAERGVRQRLIVRDVSRAPQLPGADVAEAPGGYIDRAAMTRALIGARVLFLVPAHESPNRIEEHTTAIDAAVDAGVERVVYLSFVGASADNTFTLGRHHWATEQHIRASGLDWTFVRMNLYMDFIPHFAGEDGVIRGPAGDGRVAAVLRDDLADAVVAVLTSDGHDCAVYEITGPSAFSLTEIAELLGARYVDEAEEQAYASRAGYGAPAWEVEGWVTSYLAIRNGELERVSGDLRRLTGRDGKSLREFLAQ
jgi:NAD(P)H dehydrogenase (quinone)